MSDSGFSSVHDTDDGPHTRSWSYRLRRMLLTGLLILTPVALTAFILYKLFDLMDGIFAPVLARALGRRIPGLGLLLTLAVILLLGWLSNYFVGRRLIHWAEQLIYRIPVAKSIYSGTKGVLEAISRRQTEAFKRVVLIEYPRKGLFALAFVTGNARWPQVHERTADFLLVFLPTTPNPTSGFLLLVPREEAHELPISVEDGIRMVISGGILIPRLGEVPGVRPPELPGS